MPLPFLIRPAVQADAVTVAAQILALWPEATAEEFPPDIAILAEHATSAPPRVLLVAEVAGQVVGFVVAGTRGYAEGCDTSPVAFVEGWYVAPGFRRQGLGTALLLAVEDWARGQGLQEIGSDTWHDNQPSIDAHLAAGYQEVERIVCFAKRL